MALQECPLWRKRDNLCQVLFKHNGLKGAHTCDNAIQDPKCWRRTALHEGWKTLSPAPKVELHIDSGKSAQAIAREESIISGSATRVPSVGQTRIDFYTRHDDGHKSMDDVLATAIQNNSK